MKIRTLMHYNSSCSMAKILALSVLMQYSSLIFVYGYENSTLECEEFTTCTIRYNVSTFLKPILAVKWTTNINDISTCYIGDSCITYKHFQEYITVKEFNAESVFEFETALANISRKRLDYAGYSWSITAHYQDKSSERIFDTRINIVVKPKQLTCTYNASYEGLIINCLGSMSYPESMCNFSVKFNESELHNFAITEYNHTLQNNDNQYYITRCSTKIERNNAVGVYRIEAKIYLKDSESQCIDCGKSSLTVNVAKPQSQLVNCSQHVLFGDFLECTCLRKDKSDLPTQVIWLMENKTVVIEKEKSVLKRKIGECDTEYTCMSINSYGWTSFETYNPSVIRRRNGENCSYDRPYVCSPSGLCYGIDEFCLEGHVVSCFPSHIKKEDLQSWCKTSGQFNTSLMRNKSCTDACAPFLSAHFENGKIQMPHDLWKTLCIISLILLIGLCLILTTCFLVKRKAYVCKRKSVKRSENVEEHVNTSPTIYIGLKILEQGVNTPLMKTIDEQFYSCNLDHRGMILCSEYLQNPEKHLNGLLSIAGKSKYYQTEQFIMSCIHLTVKLVINSISAKRTVANDYPSSMYEKYNLFTGSGIVIDAEQSDIECKCPKHIAEMEKSTFCIYIATATSVVLDSIEAGSTIAELDYNHKDETHIKKLYGVRIHQVIYDDVCIIQCVTCDKSIYTSIKQKLIYQKDQYKNLQHDENTVIVISHPHGMPKHISFGTFEENEMRNETMFVLSSLKHKAATCCGSEGAPVLMLNDNFQKRFSTLFKSNFFLLHSGINEMGYNNSCWGLIDRNYDEEKVTAEVDQRENCGQLKKNKHGNRNKLILEAKVSVTVSCEKLEKHEEFTEIHDFTTDKLPVGYQDQTLVDYIKTVAGLTVKLDVDFTSERRPQFIEGTCDPYPGYNISGKNEKRNGTGVIVSIIKNKTDGSQNDKCPHCKAEMYCNTFYLVYVLTSSHVIFDDSEARRSLIHVNFDNTVSPKFEFTGVKCVESDPSNGYSIILFVSHDVRLGSVSNVLKKLYFLNQTISSKHLQSESNKLTVIISHPHGNPKCVSVGEWLKREVNDKQKSSLVRYSYTTATCKGSSGAAVLILGDGIPRGVKQFLPCHVHKETKPNANNTTCNGIMKFNL